MKQRLNKKYRLVLQPKILKPKILQSLLLILLAACTQVGNANDSDPAPLNTNVEASVSTDDNKTIATDKNIVVIEKYQFIPQTIEIEKGQTIVWRNQEKRQYHSVWFEALGEPEPEYFFPDETFERQFEQSGTFEYRCGPHPEMKGTVIVK